MRALAGRAGDLLGRLRQVTLLRYLLASVGALAVDMGAYLALLALGAAATPASAACYALGIVVHWLLSSRKVFAASVAAPGIARTRQKAMFVASALVGLALTTATVGASTAAGVDPKVAKLMAIVASFTATWMMRNRIVFAPAGAAK